MIDPALHELIRRAVDDDDPTAARQLNEHLRTDPAARAAFLDYTQLHALLTWEANDESPAPPVRTASAGRPHNTAPPQPIPIYRKGHEPKPKSEIRIAKLTIAFSIAAALLAACGLAAYFIVFSELPHSEILDPTSSVPIATLIESTPGSKLSTPGGFVTPGREYAAGDYALDAGYAQFVLTNRVTVDLHGDTRLRMHSPRSVFLARGKAEFKVPGDVNGFTVQLPDRSRIVDLGTAFRVEVDGDGATRLRVTEGRVVWTADADDARPVFIDAGQSALLIDGVPTLDANPGLVAYWPLDDGAPGQTVTGADDVIDDDAHPATDAAVEGKGDTWVDDPERGVVLSTTATGNLIAGTQGINGDFTWSLWIKTTDETGHVVMGNRSGSSPWNRLTPTMTQNWASIGDDRKGTSFGVADGKWHHLVYRRAGDTVSVWIDGEQYPDTAKQTAAQDGPLRIGGDAQYGQRLVGLLSHAAVWDIALDESRIRALAAGGPVVLPQNPTNPPTPPSEPADRSEDPRDTEGPSSEKSPSLNGDTPR